ncbi:MAG: haloalkane dehalogenase [Acidimicrobiia bacterium]
MSPPAFDPTRKQVIDVLGASMAYVEHGRGDPIVLLHGNPTSSFLWRKVIPHLDDLGRCIAPDLIGMGDSEQVLSGPGAYGFLDHRRYLDALLEQLDLGGNVTLVGHDWGGALAFDWGRRHANQVRGVAYMETIVTPMTWDDWPASSTPIFKAMRGEAGEEIILEKNVFVERIIPGSVLDPMPETVLDVYRRPYLEPGESRRPTLTWPRELPIDGTPAAMVEIAEANERWMGSPSVRKLFVNAEPGSLLVGRQREVCRSWPNQTEVTVRGSHFVQEDSGDEIGEAIAAWLSHS